MDRMHPFKYTAYILLLSLSYFITGLLGSSLAFLPGYATVFWPASGIALAVVYCFGYRMLPGVFLGAVAVNFVISMQEDPMMHVTAGLWINAVSMGIGAALGAAAGAALLHGFIGPDMRLNRIRQIVQFMFLGGMIGCLLAPTWGVGTLLATGSISWGDVPFSWWTWYTGDALGVLVFSALLILFFNNHVTLQRKLAVGIPLCILFAFVIVFFHGVRQWENRHIANTFANDARMVQADIDDRFRDYLYEIQSLKSLYDSSDSVEKKEFSDFVKDSFVRNPAILALEWVPRISAANAESYLLRQRAENDPAYQFHDISGDRQIVPAAMHDEYFPVQFVEPANLGPRALGLNMGSEDIRRKALETARDKGQAVATGALQLLREPNPKILGFLVFLPIYHKNMPLDTIEAKRRALQGFVLGGFQYRMIIDPILKYWKSKGLEIILRDKTPSEASELYNSNEDNARFGYTSAAPLEVFDRQWEMEVGLRQDFLLRHVNWTIWIALALGLAFTSLCCFFLLYITGHTAEIQQIVAERTDELRFQQKSLEQARDDAAAASHAKSDFLANMSHEIRTPMTGIIGMSNLLLKMNLQGKEKHYAETIFRSAESLLQIIDDILDLSKIEASKLELEKIPFNMRRICSDVMDLLAIRAAEKKIKFELFYDMSTPESFVGDPGRIRQILFNLCSNAIKFTEKGYVHVEVSAKPLPGDASSVTVRIVDTGIGIPTDKHDVIFQKFDQADTSTTRKYGGTGLGLSICRHLVEMMGGMIDVDSVPGEGSVFHFTLALPHSRQDMQEQQEAPVVMYENAYVLLAEDNPVNQEVIRTMLENLGLNVTVVPDGVQVLERLAERPYDLVLMDCQMPVMDGFAATSRIRQLPQQSRIPIIAMTARALRGDRDTCIAAGMDDYISKPLTNNSLESVMHKWLPVEKRSTVKMPAVNVEAIEKLRTLMGAKFASVIRLYIDDASNLIAKVEAGLQKQDAAMIESSAHSLKTASGQLGIFRIQAGMTKIEKLAATNMLRDVPAVFDEVKEEYAKAKAELLKLIEQN